METDESKTNDERRGTSALTRWLCPLWMRRIISIITAPFSYHYGCCKRCERTWNIAKEHTTNYTEYRGCFPLCELCWQDLTPAERLPYYKKLYLEWGKWETEGEHKWSNIEEAVLQGK